MSVLRMRQFADGDNRYRVTVELERDGTRRSAESRFELQTSAQDQEDIRWYLEDFLLRMAEIGVDLFTKAIGNTEVWPEVRRLPHSRNGHSQNRTLSYSPQPAPNLFPPKES